MSEKMRELLIAKAVAIYDEGRDRGWKASDRIEAVVDALIAALAPQPVSVPEGWKLVPAEPTVFMLLVGVEQSFRGSPHTTNGVAGIYRAMLAAVEDK